MLWSVLGEIALAPNTTHMAMAKGGSGEDTYIAIALGECTQTASLKLQRKHGSAWLREACMLFCARLCEVARQPLCAAGHLADQRAEQHWQPRNIFEQLKWVCQCLVCAASHCTPTHAGKLSIDMISVVV
jgi:hypothetical protein